MCTSIIEVTSAEGMAKRGDSWFPLSRAVVAYDHARHAPLGDVITLDFINTDLDAGARAGSRRVSFKRWPPTRWRRDRERPSAARPATAGRSPDS